jgi:hypothetical protein
MVQKQADGRQQEGIDHALSWRSPWKIVGIMSSMYRARSNIQPYVQIHVMVDRLGPYAVEGREPRMWKLPPSKDRAKIRKHINRQRNDQWG